MPRFHKTFLRSATAWAGWVLALALVGVLFPKAFRHFYVRLPAGQHQAWEQVMAAKKAALATRWRDERPLIIMAGDSHVEMGDWYASFQGAFATRNCGLSRAKIEDVTSLVSALGDRNPEAVVLLCGINNLTQPPSVESSIELYRQLLSVVQSHLNTKRTIVLSVMPLRASVLDRFSQETNRKIARFNRELEQICRQTHVEFLDVNPALVDSGGGLSPVLTIDGLHLNQEGYGRLATVLLPHLTAALRENDRPQKQFPP